MLIWHKCQKFQTGILINAWSEMPKTLMLRPKVWKSLAHLLRYISETLLFILFCLLLLVDWALKLTIESLSKFGSEVIESKVPIVIGLKFAASSTSSINLLMLFWTLGLASIQSVLSERNSSKGPARRRVEKHRGEEMNRSLDKPKRDLWKIKRQIQMSWIESLQEVNAQTWSIWVVIVRTNEIK